MYYAQLSSQTSASLSRFGLRSLLVIQIAELHKRYVYDSRKHIRTVAVLSWFSGENVSIRQLFSQRSRL
jgi:hypothetical protein